MILQVERHRGARRIGHHHADSAGRRGQEFAYFTDRGDAVGDGVVLLEEAGAGEVGDAAGGGVGTITLVGALAIAGEAEFKSLGSGLASCLIIISRLNNSANSRYGQA